MTERWSWLVMFFDELVEIYAKHLKDSNVNIWKSDR
jgi:hypothetical protein